MISTLSDIKAATALSTLKAAVEGYVARLKAERLAGIQAGQRRASSDDRMADSSEALHVIHIGRL